LWKICADPNIPSDILAEELSAGAARWIAENTSATETALALKQRHANLPDQRETEIRAFHEWSVPSVPGRPPAEKSLDQSPIENHFLVFVPNSDLGQELALNLREPLSQVEKPDFIGTDNEDVSFLRIARHPSLGRMLPVRVLKGRSLLSSLKSSNVAVEIFPSMISTE
jgi:hypothetical protein